MKVLSVLRGAYPNFYRNISKKEAEDIVNLWTSVFLEDDAANVAAAVRVLIETDEKGYPPHPGAVKACLRRITQKKGLTPFEAWNLVEKAASNSAYCAKEEFAKLPPDVQHMVGSAAQLYEWGQMDKNTLRSVIGSNFQRSYKERSENDRRYQALPENIRRMVDMLNQPKEEPEKPGITEARPSLPEPKRETDEKKAGDAARRFAGAVSALIQEAKRKREPEAVSYEPMTEQEWEKARKEKMEAVRNAR